MVIDCDGDSDGDGDSDDDGDGDDDEVHYCTLSLSDIWVTRQSAEWEPPIWTGTL